MAINIFRRSNNIDPALEQRLKERGIVNPRKFIDLPLDTQRKILMGETPEPTGVLRFPVTDPIAKQIVKKKTTLPTTYTQSGIHRGFLQGGTGLKFVEDFIQGQILKDKSQKYFKEKFPERYKEIKQHIPTTIIPRGREQVLKRGWMTQEELDIFALPEMVMAITGLKQTGFKEEMTRVIKMAQKSKSGFEFTSKLAKTNNLSTEQIEKGFAKDLNVTPAKFWEMITGKTTSVSVPGVQMPPNITKPPIITPTPTAVPAISPSSIIKSAQTIKPPIPALPVSPVIPISKELEPLAVEAKPEVSGFTNILAKDDPLKIINKEIQRIQGLRLSGKMSVEDANIATIEARKELLKVAEGKGIATIVKENGRPTSAIRETGFYATKDIQTAPIRDVFNETLAPHLMALKQDVYKQGGEFGTVFKKIWKPTETAIRNEKTFISQKSNKITQLGKKYNIKATSKNLNHLSDVIEDKVSPTPNEQEFVQELRTILDELREQANIVREAMGKERIGYIDDYIPHIQKTSLWSQLLANESITADSLDFIIPNETKNPFAFKRMMEELPKSERNLFILLDKYVRAMAKDIYITPSIENIKAYNSVLKNRGLSNSARYWDEYIRTGLVGKQHKIDAAMNISMKGESILKKWNHMVNLAFLTGKVSWVAATQPLSYLMPGISEVGVINSLTAIVKSFNKSLRQYVRDNSNVLNIKSSDVTAIAVGEGREIQNRIYRTKIDKYNDFISVLGAVAERQLTLTSYIAGLDRAKQLGYKGEEALWFADLATAKSQSMYNRENRALILNSDVTRMVFPFSSFSIEMFNHANEILSKSGGATKLKVRERFGKLLRLILGIYLANLYSKLLTGKKKTTVGTFVPFLGSYVDMYIAKAQGKQYYGGRSPITVIQIGDDVIRGARDFLEYGSAKRLRKVGINFGLALGGIGGGGQINNIIDGIMADIDEEVKNIEGDTLFEVKDLESKIKAPIFGIWATKEGREYWEPEKETSISTGRGLEIKTRSGRKKRTGGITIKRR